MNKELYEKAKKIVLENQEAKLKVKINKEYEELLYEHQKRKANSKTLKKIKKIYNIYKNMKVKGMYNNLWLEGQRYSFQRMIKTGKYHPKDIKEAEEHMSLE